MLIQKNSIFLKKKMSKFDINKIGMTATAIRKKLADYVQIADEKKLKAIYTLLEEEIEEDGRLNIEQYNKELSEAEAEYAKGNYISNAAMKKKIKQW
jgi:hypothetical protein